MSAQADGGVDEFAGGPNSVLGKAFAILSAFDGTTESLRLTQLSRLTRIPKPTVYRLAQELVGLGLLDREGTGYRLGLSLFALGQRVSSSSLLHVAARPVIVDLCAATHATIHLAVLDGARTYYVERIAGVRGVHFSVARAGSRMPVAMTASGRLLLAMSPDPDEVLGTQPPVVPAATPDSSWFRHELDQIRDRRLAVERGEVVEGYKTFAVPITDAAARTIASLSATVGIDYDAEEQLTAHLRGAARAIGRRLTTLGMTRQAFPDPPPGHPITRMAR